MAESMENLMSSLNGLMVDENNEINELPEMNEEDAEFVLSNLSIPEGAKISNVSEFLMRKSNPKPAIVQVVTSILERHSQQVKEQKKLAYQKFKVDSGLPESHFEKLKAYQ